MPSSSGKVFRPRGESARDAYRASRVGEGLGALEIPAHRGHLAS